MAPDSRRSSCLAALTLASIAAAGASASAHRRDEYLQAARLAIDPDRVHVTIDLTPGIAVADAVVASIDADRNGAISASEARAHSEGIVDAIALELDGRSLRLELTGGTYPDVPAMLRGEGTARIDAVAHTPDLTDGAHSLRYRNGHRADIGAYLANALVPASDRVAVSAQRRDPEQRDLTIDFTVRADASTRARQGVAVGITGAVVWLMTVWRRRSRTA